jgi:transposase-like protein
MIDRPKMSMKTCPHCGSTHRHRTELSGNWKVVPFSRGYSCASCNSQYAVLFGRLSLLLERGFRPFYIPAFRH